jgi:hypothetical protein
MKDVIESLYGQKEGEPQASKVLREATNEFEIKTQSKNFTKIKAGSKDVVVPTATYVKDLEDQITKLNKDVKSLSSDYSKAVRAINALSQTVETLKKNMKNKMDRFD